jgi:pimeloyl-ACP methyl ester carboxylesterase
MPEFKEQAAMLGQRRSLVAVIARPRVHQGARGLSVVIINTGIVHRVGHHRMYVDLSRLLASHGYTVVRFDLSGIGDSKPRGDGLAPTEAAIADIGEVLDSLQAQDRTSRFVLVGLCSGADNAVLYARSDPRVVGVMLMDPTLPPTARYYLHYVLQRLRQVRPWVSVLTGRSGLMRRASEHVRHRLREVRPWVSALAGKSALRRLAPDPVSQRPRRLPPWMGALADRSGLKKLTRDQLRQRMRRARPWLSFLTDTSRPVLHAAVPASYQQPPDAGLNLKLCAQLPECYRVIAKRGAMIMAVFTELSPRHTYRQQLLDAFPEVRSCRDLRLEYLPQSDHLLSSRSDRTHLFQQVVEWLGTG